MTSEPSNDEWLRRRHAMVEDQIRVRGVRGVRVLDALLRTPRELFVPPSHRAQAYEDRALPVGQGQTISQPFMVAYMTENLDVRPEHSVLEIGTGTGYQTAVLAVLAARVFTVERLSDLQVSAAQRLAELGIANVQFHNGDGSLGLPEHAPFDRIMVTAGAPRVPHALVDQLADGGRMIVPVGASLEQTIVVVARIGARVTEMPMLACRFVKLIGQDAWSAADIADET
ncbi:MAG: protein-L-isoaspartate(D-aspartate) O-methyltransferase [Planctomycetes bacterium]|nr:protein-L-isoaspartate(D-aspartate) O-methyltransferase [Planctomycetota bacterium]